MRISILDLSDTPKDLLALRRAIDQLADRCGLELADGPALRRLLDGDFSACRASARNLKECQELSAMLTLLFRLEASSSEDLGITGLRRLWRQHGRILARFRGRKPMADSGHDELAAF